MIVSTQPSCHNRLKSLNSFSVSLLAHLRFPFGHCQAIRTHRLAGGGSIIKRNVTHRILPRREEPAPYPPTTTARPRGPLQDRAVAGFATSVGLFPSCVTHPATLSHPHCCAAG